MFKLADQTKESPEILVGVSEEGVVARPARERSRRLSVMQESLLLGHLMSPNPEKFNVPLAVSLSGKLDKAALQNAFDVLVRRHEVLRTRYFVKESLPFIEVDSAVPVAIKEISWSETSPAREEEIRKVIDDEASRPFFLEREWPVRVRLFCRGADQHTLLVVLHHIACDEGSLSIFRDELASVYEASVEGRTLAERPLPMQYSDYAEEQRCWMLGPEMQRELVFWRRELAGAPAALPLGEKRSCAPLAAGESSVYGRSIDGQTAERCLALCATYRSTPFALLLAALAATLGQHTGMDDILIGTPISTRGGNEMERLIGYFVNTIVLRTKLERNMTFAKLAQQTRATAFRAFAHRTIPFQKVVEELAPPREPDVHPFFRVMLSFHRDNEKAVRFGELNIKQVPLPSNSLKCDLLVSVRLEGAKIDLECEFNPARFDLAYGQRLMKKFTTLLHDASLRPTAPLEDCYSHLNRIDREFFETQASEVRSGSLTLLKNVKRVAAQA
jgi:hypothetical protein